MQTFPLMYRRLIISSNLIHQFLVIFPKLSQSFAGVHVCVYVGKCLSILLGLILWSFTYLVYVWVEDRDLVSSFYILLPSFPNTFYLRGCLLVCFLHWFLWCLWKLRWLKLHSFASGSSILFCWPICLLCSAVCVCYCSSTMPCSFVVTPH